MSTTETLDYMSPITEAEHMRRKRMIGEAIGNTFYFRQSQAYMVTVDRADGITTLSGVDLLFEAAKSMLPAGQWVDVGSMIGPSAVGHMVKVDEDTDLLHLRLDDWPAFVIEVDFNQEGCPLLYMPGASWPAVFDRLAGGER